MTQDQFDELKKLLQKNNELLVENTRLTHNIRKMQIIGSVWAWIKILIVVGTILAGFIYLPPFINNQLSRITSSITNDGPSAILERFGIQLDRGGEKETTNSR
jgi:hypothetical protein